MEPLLHDGDRLLALPLRPRTGDIVVARDPREPGRLLVKRARSAAGGVVRLASESAHADHHEDRGDLAESDVLGRVVLRYAPLSRFGRVR